MKTSRILGVAMLAWTVLACHEEETSPGKGEVQLQFNVAASAQNSSGRVQLIPEGVEIRFSLEDESGNQIYHLKEIALLKLGLDYVTEPLELEVKGYRVTDFFIVNDEGHVLFAIPRQGTPLARLVRKPLPIFFKVEKSKLVNIDAQVVRVGEENTAGDFGYASFSVEEAAYPEFSVSVLTAVNGNLKHTASRLYLIQEDDTVYSKNLPASMSEVIFKGKPDDVYTLVATKEDYSRYIKTFQLQALRDSLQGRPLQIYLEPIFTVVFNSEVFNYLDSPYFSMIIDGTAGSKIKIDWGDGSVETYTLPGTSPLYDGQIHRYSDALHTPGENVEIFVTVTGELDRIRSVAFRADLGSEPERFSLKHLSGLERFQVLYNHRIKQIDFSGNPNLRRIDIAYTSIDFLNISANGKLNWVSVPYIDFNTNEVDRFISDLYEIVSTNNTMGGYLSLVPSNSSDEFPGPPSPVSLQMLYDLQALYGWQVNQ